MLKCWGICFQSLILDFVLTYAGTPRHFPSLTCGSHLSSLLIWDQPAGEEGIVVIWMSKKIMIWNIPEYHIWLTSNMWQATSDLWQVTGDTLHMTRTHGTWPFLGFLVSVLLLAHFKRLSVSRLRDFFTFYSKFYILKTKFIIVNFQK